MNFTTRKPDGALYSITAYGGIRVMGGTLGVADGFEWSLDDTEMHFTDTAEKTIYRGPFRQTGELDDVRSSTPVNRMMDLPSTATLFVGSARENLAEAQLEAHPLSGAIFAIDTRTHGRPARSFDP